MSFKEILTILTRDNNSGIPAQLVLKNGMQIVTPRRLSEDLDPEMPKEAIEASYDDFTRERPGLFVGMVIAPQQNGQVSLVKAIFDPYDVVSLVFVSEENLPKIGHDRPPVPRGGRTASGLIVP